MGGEGAHRSRLRRADARARGAVRQLRFLLDTQIALWWLNEPAQLEDDAREAIAHEANDVYLSTASIWEAAIKSAAGRLTTPTPMIEAAEAAALLELPIRSRHVVRAADLPPLHGDPFDRMLVAQALDEGLVLATRDPLVRQYAVAAMPA